MHINIEKLKTDDNIGFNKNMKEIEGLFDKNHQITSEIAENSIILLKNESNIYIK